MRVLWTPPVNGSSNDACVYVYVPMPTHRQKKQEGTAAEADLTLPATCLPGSESATKHYLPGKEQLPCLPGNIP